MTYLVEYLRVVTPYKPGDQVPIMREDRARALVRAGVAKAVGWTAEGPPVDKRTGEVIPAKTLAQIDPEGITVQSQTDTGTTKAPDAPLHDRQIKQGWRRPVSPIRK